MTWSEWRFPSATNLVAADGDNAWVNPANAYANDSALVSTGSLPKAGGNTNRRRWTGFGFDTAGGVPAVASGINGIEVELLGATGGDTITIWVYNGTTASPVTRGGIITGSPYGGATDQFGLTLTPAQVRGSGFGIELRCTNPTAFGASTNTFDALRARVNYIGPIGQAKRWNGSTWANVEVNGWDGTQQRLVSFWDGNVWVDQ